MLSGNIINLMLMKSYAARDYSVILVDIMRNSEIGFFFFQVLKISLECFRVQKLKLESIVLCK